MCHEISREKHKLYTRNEIGCNTSDEHAWLTANRMCCVTVAQQCGERVSCMKFVETTSTSGDLLSSASSRLFSCYHERFDQLSRRYRLPSSLTWARITRYSRCLRNRFIGGKTSLSTQSRVPPNFYLLVQKGELSVALPI